MAPREEILDQVRTTMSELFEIEPSRIQLETRVVEDLDLDSIDAIELAVRIEAATGRRLDPERFRDMRTVGDVVDILAGMLAGDPAEGTAEAG